MIEFLITILLFCVVFYVVKLAIDTLTLPQPIKNITYLILGLIGLLFLLDRFGVYHMRIY